MNGRFTSFIILVGMVTTLKAQNVGIGTPNPPVKLSIQRAAGYNIVGFTQGQVGGTATMEMTTDDGTGSQATRLLLRGNGPMADFEIYTGARGAENRYAIFDASTESFGLGLGTGLPSEKLHIAGNARITDLGGVGNALVLTDNNGVLSRTALSGNTTDVLDGTGNFVPFSSLDNDWALNGTDLHSIPTGNVGIGTTTPSEKLHVAGSARLGSLKIGMNATGGTATDMYIVSNDGSGNWNQYWNSAGTTTPTRISNGAAYKQQIMQVGTNSINSNYRIFYGGFGAAGSAITWQNAIDIRYDNGNIGIHNNNPTTTLDVGGKTRTTEFQMTTAPTAGFVLKSDANGNGTWQDPDDGDWAVNGNNMSSIPTGNVGIGTNTPTEKLHVNGDLRLGLIMPANSGAMPSYGPRIHFSGSGAPGGTNSENTDHFFLGRYNVSNNKSELRMAIGDDGNPAGWAQDAFVIGTTGFNNIAPFTEKFRFESDGVARKPGGGTWAATSDRRTKKDIQPFTDGLRVLKEINPVTFKYNGKYNTTDDNKEHVGIIAQEVQQVAPYMIGRVKRKATPESQEEEILNYDGGGSMIYVLVNSVKEQQKIIEQLQKENAALKSTIQSEQDGQAIINNHLLETIEQLQLDIVNLKQENINQTMSKK